VVAEYSYYLSHWQVWIAPISVFFVTLFAGWLAKRWLFRLASRWSTHTTTLADDILTSAIRQPFMLWILMLAIYLASESSTLPERYAVLIGKVLLVLWVVSLTVVTSRIASGLVRHYGSNVQGLQVTSLTENIARLVVIVIGLLILLNGFGISITPILTALGVGGLAVALALQDTLSNLFAGIYIFMSRKIRPGDFIQIENGAQGYVCDINLRHTTIRELANNLLVPNTKMASAVNRNYSLPEQEVTVLVDVGVS